MNWGHWLGTGRQATRDIIFRDFHAAREFARNLNLKRQVEWFNFSKDKMPEKGELPKDIPADPRQTYSGKGWVNYGDWLGTGRVHTKHKKMRSFEEARQFVHSLELQSQSDWVKFRRGQLPEKGPFPEDMPTNPARTYKGNGWLSWGDWLGTNSIAAKDKTFLQFHDAKSWVRNLKLNNRDAWRKACLEGRIPEEIPRTPERHYRDSGWISMGDWLGTGNISNRDKAFRDFDSARDWARALGLQSSFQWRKFCSGAWPEYGKRPEDIPANPERIYQKNGWRGYGDWLGTDAIATNLRDYLPFEEAREFVHSLNLKNTSEWRKFCKGQLPDKGELPANIPATPNRTYKAKVWKGMRDWLGKTTK